MKTTLVLPDTLFKQLKVAATLQGITLKKLVTEALEEKLHRSKISKKPAWKKLIGTFKQDKKEILKIQKIIDQEFSQIRAEDWK